jgi:[acyl-carrier-protein] S-malonyltransferase
MQAAADATNGSMVSIIGLDEQKVHELVDEAAGDELLVPANFNCPGQIVISGAKAACKRAESLAPKFGAIKVVPLAVAGAFHTDMMAAAADTLAFALDKTKIANPSDIKVIANINAEYYGSADQIRTGLKKQLTCPILWQKCMEKLIADRIETFYEIGPGRVLTGLMKRINRNASVINISAVRALKDLKKP